MNSYRKFSFALTVIIVLFVSCSDFQSKDLTFESEKWKNGNSSFRARMISDLLKSKVLENKTKTEVIEVLGGPDNDENGYFIYKFEFGGWLDKIFLIKYHLIITFNLENKVNQTMIADY